MKTIRILLALLILLSAVSAVACEKENDTPDVTTEIGAQTTESPYIDNLPADLKFDGEKIVFHVRGDADAIRDVFVESGNNPVDSALYNRTLLVENRLNVDISHFEANPWQKYSESITTLKASIESQDGAFDVVAGWSAHIPSLAMSGLFLDLNELEYLDLDEKWWNQSLNRELTVKNKIFFCNGDISLTSISNAQVFLFNKKLQAEYQVEDLYQTVLNKEWTIDKLLTYAKTIYKDNGDSQRNDLDTYGYIMDGVNDADGFLQASNIKMFSRDDDGLPYLDLDYEKVNSLYEIVKEFCHGKLLGCYSDPMGGIEWKQEMFMDDRALLMPTELISVERVFTQMDTEYGIIPYPMYDETQGAYYSRPQDAVALYSVPLDAKDEDISAAVMEALAAEGYNSVTDVYFEVAMKHRYSKDDSDAASQMLDIIREGQLYTFGSVYNNSIGRPWDCLRILMENPQTSFATWYGSQKTIIENLTTRYINKLDEMT